MSPVLRGAGIFAVAALALAWLPDRPWPALGGLNLHTLAVLTTLILALQVAGGLVVRWLGPGHGLWAWGLVSGFVSSTATIAAMAVAHRRGTAPPAAALAAAAASSVATWVQTLIMSAAVDPSAARALLPMALCAALTAAVASARVQRRRQPGAPPTDTTAHAATPHAQTGGLRVVEALAVAGLIAGVTVVIGWARHWGGGGGVLAGSALAGLADAHAPVASLASLHRDGQLDVDTLRVGVWLAVAANTATRIGVAWQAGGADFARPLSAVLLLGLGAAAVAAAVVLLGPWA